MTSGVMMSFAKPVQYDYRLLLKSHVYGHALARKPQGSASASLGLRAGEEQHAQKAPFPGAPK